MGRIAVFCLFVYLFIFVYFVYFVYLLLHLGYFICEGMGGMGWDIVQIPDIDEKP